ncbi:MAG TPA: radical SAM protein [Treponemataceae bacterium]|nr:radical SAM protein [Treponemataceae bacterium]
MNYIEAKSGISRGSLPEPYLVSLYRVLSPYRGCGHGCRYCDGRAEKYFVEGDFEKDILVRENLNIFISSQIAEGYPSKEWGAFCMSSGVTDIYQPLEKELQLTRKTLEALIPSELPVVILTKNALIERDFDLLERFPQALVILTITTVNENHSKLLEPNASSPAERLETIKKARLRGFHAGIMAMPLCPGISAEPESVRALFDSCEASGADFIYPGGLTLRPGCQKEEFKSLLEKDYAHLLPLYESVYCENRPSGMPRKDYSFPFMKNWDADLRRRSIPQMIPHTVYKDLLSPPDSMFVLLCHMQSLYMSRNINVRPLKDATDLFSLWLKTERTTLRRKRIKTVSSDPFPITRILTEKFNSLCENKGTELEKILKNKKLSSLLSEIHTSQLVFNYSKLCAEKPVNL